RLPRRPRAALRRSAHPLPLHEGPGDPRAPAAWRARVTAMARPKAIVSFSSGKDSAFALEVVRQAGELEIVGLLTTVAAAHGRVSIHGVREVLLDRQIAAIGLPCTKVSLPSPCPNAVYPHAVRRRPLPAPSAPWSP